jgi:hypothetical protein
MPTVFASVSVTIIFFFLATIGMAYFHLLSVELHMIWGFFVAILVVLLQCLIFGFFIGSGKSIKRVVQDNGLSADWVQKTKDYKNQSYPALMLAIVISAVAAILGGGAARGAVPIWLHEGFIWLALALNARSLWVSYKVVVANVNAIHRINAEVQTLKKEGKLPLTGPVPSPIEPAAVRSSANRAANYYFLAAAIWVPYLYMKVSLGSRTFPFWPFLGGSALLLILGIVGSRKSSGS